jgi:hypothetical protein
MKRRLRNRSGSVLQEALAAVGMGAIVVASIAQLLAVASRQWVASEQRSLAVRETGNAMEEVLSRPWAGVQNDKLSDIGLSQTGKELLPDAKLKVTAIASETEKDSLQIRIELDWRNPAGQRAAPVRLVAWRYRSED